MLSNQIEELILKKLVGELKIKIPNHFSLYRFEKIFTAEKEAHQEILTSFKLDIKTVERQVQEYNYPISRKYVLDNVLLLTNGSYCVKMEEADDYEILDAKTFNIVYGKTINEFNANITKRAVKRYTADVYLEDFRIDAGKESEIGRINLAKKMSYMYNSKVEKLTKNETQLYDLFLNDFVKKIICKNNDTSFDFLSRILSGCLHYQRTNKITVFSGIGGTGKTTFMNFLSELTGKAFATPQHDVITGNDKFNVGLQGCVVCYVEETSGKGESNYMDMFKKMKENCTAEQLNIRPMHGTAYNIKNMINYFISTNFTADLIYDRRIFSLEVSNEKVNDSEFFAEIKKAMSNKKIMQHLFNYFYNLDYKKIAGDAPPESELMKDKQLIETDIDRFLLHTYVFEENKNISMTLSQLFVDYNEWRVKNGKPVADTNSKSSFNSALRNILNEGGINKDKVKLYNVSKDAITAVYNKIKKWSKQDIEDKKRDHVNKINNKKDSTIGEFFDEKAVVEKENAKLKKEKQELIKEIEELKKLLKEQKKAESESDDEEPKKMKKTKKNDSSDEEPKKVKKTKKSDDSDEEPKKKESNKTKKVKFDNYDHDGFLNKLIQ